ncbi:MAG: hypothetical protein JNL74_06410, partial [Fibrobacteres bacterium]|nr:hypothetical protein [Fibrobacterota bacterium]
MASKASTLTISYIMNYHNGGGIGHIIVNTASYAARWCYEEPTKVMVTDPACSEPCWMELPIAGCLSEVLNGETVDHEPLALTAFHSDKVNISALKGTRELSEAKLEFYGVDDKGFAFVYELIFFADRIERVMKVRVEKSFALSQWTFGGNKVAAITIAADTVFDPNPVSHGIFKHPLSHACSAREKWFTPGPFCYPYRLVNGSWLSVSLEPRADQMQFCRFQTVVPRDGKVGFKATYDSLPEYSSEWESPALVFRFGAKDEFEALKKYADGLVDSGKIGKPERKIADWWHGVIVCGWHEQMHQATLHNGQGPDYCTPAVYNNHMAEIEEAGIRFDIIMLD